MTATRATLNAIMQYVANLQKETVRRVLLLYEEEIRFIGDACVRFDKIRYFKSFLNNAAITINFNTQHSPKIYDALLKNNVHVHEYFSKEWDEIDFTGYDVIFSVAYNELTVLQYIHDRYGTAIVDGRLPAVVCSLSDFLLEPDLQSQFVFPVYKELVDYCRNGRQGELYIGQDERDRANAWLKAHGMKDSEQLFVILDSTADRDKLMNINVYFELLSALLTLDDIKILIFDENNVGKEEFYREWLGPVGIKKIIVSKGLSLRENICLTTSKYTRLVFGPCTGLLHCASSVYNHYLTRGMPVEKVPVLITYTGKYKHNDNAGFWWGDSPLVNCLLLKERNNKKELVLLSDMPEEEQQLNDALSCSEYTPELLLNFILDKIAVQPV